MDNLEQNIRQLVSEVLKEMEISKIQPSSSGKVGVFQNIEEAINAR